MDNQFEWVMTDTLQFEKQPLAAEQFTLLDHEVLVKPHYVGICGSDLFLIHGNLKNLRLGHEWVGEVVSIGPKVTDFKVGGLVTGTGHFACGKCNYCQDGKSNLCNSSIHFSSDKIGALRSLFKAPEDQILQLTQELDSSLALIEVFAVGEQAYELIKTPLETKKTKEILILGAGAIGLAVACALKSYGYDFTIVEKISARVENAKRMGFKSLHLQEAILNPIYKNHFNILIDCTNDYSGDTGGLKWLNFFSEKEYTGLIVGKYLKTDLNVNTFNSKAAQLIWMRGVANAVLKKTIHKWESKLKSLKTHFISHEYPLEEIQTAFKTADDRPQSLKVIIRI